MTRLIPFALALLLAAPAAAQEAAQESEAAEGFDLLGEGANLLLRGLIEEARPAIEEVAGIGAELIPTFRVIAQEMGPAFVEVFERIDSIENYDPPVILPNGDIVLRRRPGAPDWSPPPEVADPNPAPEVEL